MKTIGYTFLLCITTSLLWIACSRDDDQQDSIQVFSASGGIGAVLISFRQKLGEVNTTPGNSSGRREINWESVPDSFETVQLPQHYFNPVGPNAPVFLQRGFTYSPGSDARVSATSFASLEPGNATEFAAFSGNKTFATIGNNEWNVEFEVAGQPVPASVDAFGAVFSDIDVEGSTTMQFFSGTESLGLFNVPAKTTGSHSFLGVYVPGKKITRVEIRQGNAPIGLGVKDISAGGTQDLVLMDDVVYSEPKAD